MGRRTPAQSRDRPRPGRHHDPQPDHEHVLDTTQMEGAAMKLTLTISLGNEAMRTAGDIAATLRRIAVDLDDNDDGQPLTEVDRGGDAIRDLNGNPVGSWRLT